MLTDAHTLGVSTFTAYRLIILPQALKISTPGIVNSFIELFKDTSLVAIIGLFDFLRMAQVVVRSGSACRNTAKGSRPGSAGVTWMKRSRAERL